MLLRRAHTAVCSSFLLLAGVRASEHPKVELTQLLLAAIPQLMLDVFPSVFNQCKGVILEKGF